jgi:hypothetical protein
LWWILLKVIYTIIVAIYIIPKIWFAIGHKENIAENYRTIKEINYNSQEFKLINNQQYYKIKFEDTKASYRTWENWINRFHIKDKNKSCHQNNRPISITTEKWKLYINILDTCGWWSGDWYISKMELRNKWILKLVWCYNYDNRWQFEPKNEENWSRYFNWTTQYEKLKETKLSDCEWNFEIIYYNKF